MLHYFKEPKKFPENLDYFCKKNCYQEVQKIAQSGHTDRVRRALERVGGDSKCARLDPPDGVLVKDSSLLSRIISIQIVPFKLGPFRSLFFFNFVFSKQLLSAIDSKLRLCPSSAGN